MLRKHPDLIDDDELRAWIDHLVNDQVEEGPTLDYKELQKLDAPSDRREVAKDVSSFANEHGGTLLYGVPEEESSHGGPVPRKPYGMPPIPNFESRVENLLTDGVRPSLPESRIRTISVSTSPLKVVHLVWVPESWVGVHMVEGFHDRRYYRRGQYRAVVMTERDVRDRYERVLAAKGWLDAFLRSVELNYLGDQLPGCFKSHFVACPGSPLVAIDFAQPDMRTWLERQFYPSYPSYRFQPSSQGARTPLEIDRTKDRFEPFTELYCNGAVSHWRVARITPHGMRDGTEISLIAYLAEFSELFQFLRYSASLYSRVGYSGPVHVSWEISHPTLGEFRRLHLPQEVGHEPLPLVAPGDTLRIDVEDSAMTLISEPKEILRQLGDGLFRCFGLWEVPKKDIDSV